MTTLVRAPEAPATAPPGGPTGRRLVWRNTLAGWSFIAPNFIGFAVLTMVPCW
jgi:multiple sugar transport system permease protein/alpha-1,4-digalacturonate transport system permease protein